MSSSSLSRQLGKGRYSTQRERDAVHEAGSGSLCIGQNKSHGQAWLQQSVKNNPPAERISDSLVNGNMSSLPVWAVPPADSELQDCLIRVNIPIRRSTRIQELRGTYRVSLTFDDANPPGTGFISFIFDREALWSGHVVCTFLLCPILQNRIERRPSHLWLCLMLNRVSITTELLQQILTFSSGPSTVTQYALLAPPNSGTLIKPCSNLLYLLPKKQKLSQKRLWVIPQDQFRSIYTSP